MPVANLTYKLEHIKKGCMNPACKSHKRLEVHHIIPKCEGGESYDYNYILLCHECHRSRKIMRSNAEMRAKLFEWKDLAE